MVIAKNTCVTGTITATSSPLGPGTVSLVLGSPLVNGSGTSFSASDVGKALEVGVNRIVIAAVNAGTQQLTLQLGWQWSFTNPSQYKLITYSGNAVSIGIGVQGTNDFEVIDNYISGSASKVSLQAWGYGIMLYPSTSLEYNVVSGNRIHTCDGPGIYVQSPYTVVSSNVIDDPCRKVESGSLLMAAIGVTYSGDHVIVEGNVVRLSNKDGIRFQAPNCTISNNVIQGLGSSPRLGFGIVLAASNEVLLTNAVVTGNTTAGCAGGITTSGFTSALKSSGGLIADNVVEGGTGGNNGIAASYFSDIVISGNEVKAASGYGVAVTNADNVVVTGNLVKNSSQHLNDTYSGIYLADVAQGIVTCNRAFSPDSGNRQKYGIQELGGTGIVISNNLLYNYVTGAISVAGTGVSRAGNRVSQSGTLSGRRDLSSGTRTVDTTEVLASDNILLAIVVPDSTPANIGSVRVDSITAGASFVIKSTNVNDSSTVFWQIVH